MIIKAYLMSSSLNTANYSKRTYKIVLLGNSGVGKTCLIERFTSNKYDPKDTVIFLLSSPLLVLTFLGKMSPIIIKHIDFNFGILLDKNGIVV